MKSLNTYNSGGRILVEQCSKINVNDVVSEATQKIRPLLMQAVIKCNGFDVELTTSNPHFGGERYWFKCPLCGARVGIIYQHPLTNLVGCRTCLGLDYRSRRYKGMVENSLS